MSAGFEDYKLQAGRSNHGGVPYAALEEFHDLIVQAPTESGAVALLRERFRPHIDWMLRNGRPPPVPRSGRAQFQIHPRVWGREEETPVVQPPDEFSQRAFEELYARFPEWRQYETSVQDYDESFAQIQLPCPSESAAEHGLIVHARFNQVTVAFDFHHTFDEHFQPDGALGFMARLFEESIAALSWWDGEHFRLSAVMERGKRPPTAEFSFSNIRVRSWKGSLDEDIAA